MGSQCANELVKAASPNMSNVIRRKLTVLAIIIVIIASVSHACANGSVNNKTWNIDRSIDHETQSYLSHMRILHRQNRGYRDAEQKNIGINGASDGKGEALAKAAELIERARAGGPSGLVHLGSASDALNRPIEVYDEQGELMYVVGDTKNGTSAKVEYHESKDREIIGHYTLPGGKEPNIRSRGRNMCLYNVLAEQTGHDPNKLKDSVLDIMTKNIETFAKQMNDIAHLEMYSRMKLAPGGAVFDAQNPDETLMYLRESDGKFGFRNTNRGHPGHHIPYRRSTESLLNFLSAELNKRIEVYNDEGELLKTVGKNIKGEAIKLEYHKPEGDTSGEYFSSVNGTEMYRLNDPRPPSNVGSVDFWGVVITALNSTVTKKMDKFKADNPEQTLSSPTQSIRTSGFPKTNEAHSVDDIPYSPSTKSLLDFISAELNKKIEVYDDKGKPLKTVGENIKSEAIKLEYHKSEGETSGEYFSSVGGREVYRLNGLRPPKDPKVKVIDFWEVVKATLKSKVTENMDEETIPHKTYCVEIASHDKGKWKGMKSGYISKDEAGFVTYYAMQTDDVKQHLAKLNEYAAGVNDSQEYVSADITLSADDLNLPRTAFGAEWNNEKIVHVWPITGPIFIKLQHYKGNETDRTAWVQFQTNYPKAPPKRQYVF